MAVAVNSHRKMKMEGGLMGVGGGGGEKNTIYLSICKTVALIFSKDNNKTKNIFNGIS